MTMNMNLDSVFTSLLDPALNDFQAWALQHPEEDLSRTILPLISFAEGLLANEPTYLDSKRREFGPNYLAPGADLATWHHDPRCRSIAEPRCRRTQRFSPIALRSGSRRQQ